MKLETTFVLTLGQETQVNELFNQAGGCAFCNAPQEAKARKFIFAQPFSEHCSSERGTMEVKIICETCGAHVAEAIKKLKGGGSRSDR